jgi:hypothetical protein
LKQESYRPLPPVVTVFVTPFPVFFLLFPFEPGEIVLLDVMLPPIAIPLLIFSGVPLMPVPMPRIIVSASPFGALFVPIPGARMFLRNRRAGQNRNRAREYSC